MRAIALLICLPLTAAAQTQRAVVDLNEAIIRGDLAAVRTMIREGVDVNGIDDEGRTPLTLAAFHHKRTIVQSLLEANADPALHGFADMQPMTPIDAAAASGDPKTLRLILDAVPAEFHRRTVLMAAAARGHLDTVRLLLDLGVDPTVSPESVYRAARGGFLAMLELLLLNGSDPNSTSPSGQSAIFGAVEAGRTESLSLLLRRGADPELGDPRKGLSPLALATKAGRGACARILVSFGADVDHANEEGRRAIHIAAVGSRPTMIDLLVSLSANVDAQDAHGSTPLLLAVSAGATENARRLLAAHANKTVANNEGVTPLEQARKMERPDLVELLED